MKNDDKSDTGKSSFHTFIRFSLALKTDCRKNEERLILTFDFWSFELAMYLFAFFKWLI